MQEIKIDSFDIPVPSYINNYSDSLKSEIFEYLQQMDDLQKKAYKIAYNHLGTSFNICRSNGFKDWKKQVKQ